MRLILKEIVVCSCNMLFDFLYDMQFCRSTMRRPINYDNVIIGIF